MDEYVPHVRLQAYAPAHRDRLLEVFDRNSPSAFAPNERADFCAYLDHPSGYEVAQVDGTVVGGAGLEAVDPASSAIRWILVDPEAHGLGVGRALIERMLSRLKERGHGRMLIAASHVSEPFFARFGARTHSTKPDGWGPGMHRVDMVLEI